MSNPLLGNRISLISKKNIRYDGTLYSINEADATVALADVRSYGTEGREKLDPNPAAYVPPQDTVHPYLLFRGCDIKDLHVHERHEEEKASMEEPPPDPAIVSTKAPPEIAAKKEKQQQMAGTPPQRQEHHREKENSQQQRSTHSNNNYERNHNYASSQQRQQQSHSARYNNNNGRNNTSFSRRPRKLDNLIGTGASLLNRKARGAVNGTMSHNTGEDFDFESSTAEFHNEKSSNSDTESNGNLSGAVSAYDKNDFFDSISCDALDKRDGIDNRLRGAAERNLNTETFGAVSLGNGRRGGRRHYHHRRSNGAGRGGGRGRPREQNQRWKRVENGGGRRTNGGGGFAQPPTARAGGDR